MSAATASGGCAGSSSRNGGARASRPLSAVVSPSAVASRAGPLARSLSDFDVGRLVLASSCPATISPARSRSADATPSGPHTILAQWCMPYVKYT